MTKYELLLRDGGIVLWEGEVEDVLTPVRSREEGRPSQVYKVRDEARHIFLSLPSGDFVNFGDVVGISKMPTP
jgi:hypothetical protein